jgi:hypothetical protein
MINLHGNTPIFIQHPVIWSQRWQTTKKAN